MSDLMKRLKKNSRLDSEVITKSKYHGKSEFTATDTPMLNVALSGDIDGGLQKGILTLAGPSKHFKTAFSLKLASEFMKEYPESIMLFYDSEFGSPSSYFEMAGIDMERVLHTPVKNLEEFKFDIVNQLENLTDTDQIIIVVDSIGNLASKKELEDALAEKSTADMTRAKVLKGIFRMITPFINMKFIPFIGIAHTYDTQEMYSKKVVSGGCLVAGTKIKLDDGSLINIEEIEVGQLLSTLNGPREVTHVWNPNTLEEGRPECYEIEFEDGYKVTCSDRHKFLIEGCWVEAKDLVVGMDCKTL